MIQASGVIICIGYILGLLLTAVPLGGFWVLFLGVVGAVFFKRLLTVLRKSPPTKNPSANTKIAPPLLQTTPPSRIWLIAGVVGLLASFYFQLRLPQPKANDISKFVPAENNNHQEQLFIIRGEVASSPRLTRSGRAQFWLQATELDEVKNDHGSAGVSKGVAGKLYVTVPLLQSTGLHPNQQVAVTGVLYKPKPAANPGSFDFKKYLQQQEAFAGLSGIQVNILDDERKWGLSKVRERIVRSLVRGLGIPNGFVESAMVLGTKAVDLPYDLRDSFVLAGLAHALAAPGLKTSLILGFVLTLTKRSTRLTRFTFGTIALILFLILTGLQPGALRAVIMGFTALIGIGLKRKVKKLGSLLVAAVLLLLFNPLWIWDLGFQLSFLATLGLVVTFPAIIQLLEWLPPTIACAIAAPISASIWTLPLLLHTFSIVLIYSLPVCILTSPLISIIIMGGMISALAGLIVPNVGSFLASTLYFPIQWLIQLVEFFAHLPGSVYAVGSISIGQTVGLYTVIVLAWLVPWWQKRWWFAGLIAVSLVIIPSWHSANTLFQVTVLATGGEPMLVIQDHGKITLINSGDEGTGRFTLLPFLQQQGVNQIDWAVAAPNQLNSSSSWLEVLQNLPIKEFYDYSPMQKNGSVSVEIQNEVLKHKGIYQALSIGQTVSTGTTAVQLINDQFPILQIQISGKNWLFVGNIKPNELNDLSKAGGIPHPQVLWCAGQSLKELVLTLQPEVAIASSTTLDQKTVDELSQTQTKLFIAQKDGAVQWTPNGQFETFIQATENKTSVF